MDEHKNGSIEVYFAISDEDGDEESITMPKGTPVPQVGDLVYIVGRNLDKKPDSFFKQDQWYKVTERFWEVYQSIGLGDNYDWSAVWVTLEETEKK